MNPLLRLFVTGSLLVAATCFAADSFEGKVSLAMTANKGKPQVLNYSIKGQVMRMDLDADGHTFASIMDLGKQEMLMLMPEQKMYMVMPMKKIMEKAAEQSEIKEPNVEKTGRTETILGYKCDEYISKDKNVTTEIWVAEGLGTFMGLGNSGGNPMAGMFGGKGKAAEGGWADKFKGKGGFPLRVISRDAKSKETFRMEATKIEPGSLPNSLFIPPAGYEKFAMPSFGGMFK